MPRVTVSRRGLLTLRLHDPPDHAEAERSVRARWDTADELRRALEPLAAAAREVAGAGDVLAAGPGSLSHEDGRFDA